MGAARIERRRRRGVDTCLLKHGDLTEAFITVHVNGEADTSKLLAEAWEEVTALGATVLRQTVFGIPAQHEHACAMLREACGETCWPVTWLEEGASQGERLTGTQIHAVAGAEVTRLEDEGGLLGSVYRDGSFEYAVLAGVMSGRLDADRATQTRDVLERLERVLGRVGMSFADVARTWFYNDRILDWYDDFNRVRTAFFQQRDVFSGLVPASTGIGGGNLPGAALVAEALALRPLDAQASDCAVRKVVSPLQCPATNYRSSFSRAVEIRGKDWRKLLISGTASIDSDGKTARLGDVAGQIELTVDVIEAILGSCGMDWCDVSRAIAYVKNGASAALYEQVLTSRNIAPFPAIVTENDICRDDLLFELEIDAITAEKAVEASS